MSKSLRVLASCALFASTAFVGCERSTPTATVGAENEAASGAESTAAAGVDRKALTITEAAAAKLAETLGGDDARYIRVAAVEGGPAGLIYDLKPDDTPIAIDDWVDTSYGFRVVVDPVSAPLLDGAKLDLQTLPDGRSGFYFDNPNAPQPDVESEEAEAP